MSPGRVMQLLAALYTSGLSRDAQKSLPEMLPRSWPLFRHSLSSIRAACVHCLAALAEAPANSASADDMMLSASVDESGVCESRKFAIPNIWLRGSLLTSAVRLLFQNVLVEGKVAIRQASQDTLQRIVQQSAATDLQQAFPSELAHRFLQLAGTSAGLAWPAGSLVQVQGPAASKPFADYPKDANGELAADIRVAAAECLAFIGTAQPAGQQPPVTGMMSP